MPGVVAPSQDLAKVAMVVCDIDGVVYRGTEGIPGAGDALERIERTGIELVFATNNATKTPREAAEQIATRCGYPAAADQVVTSATATATWLRAEGVARALVLGESALEAALEREGVRVVAEPGEAEAVVAGLDRHISYTRLARAMTAVLGGATLYATNTDPSFPAADGLRPGAGSIVAALQAATGVAPVVCGKPHEPMSALLRERADRRAVAVIGDRPETDLALGMAEGWLTFLVLTGVTASAAAVPDALVPTHTVPSLIEVADLLTAG